MTGKQWRWIGWMAFSVLLLVVFAYLAWGNIQDIRDAESTTAVLIEEPILSPAGEGEIATARVRFTTEAGATVEAFVIGVPTDAAQGDTVTVHFLGSKPEDATVDDPPNRTLGLVLSSLFALIGAGGIWGWGHEYPFGEDENQPAS